MNTTTDITNIPKSGFLTKIKVKANSIKVKTKVFIGFGFLLIV